MVGRPLSRGPHVIRLMQQCRLSLGLLFCEGTLLTEFQRIGHVRSLWPVSTVPGLLSQTNVHCIVIQTVDAAVVFAERMLQSYVVRLQKGNS